MINNARMKKFIKKVSAIPLVVTTYILASATVAFAQEEGSAPTGTLGNLQTVGRAAFGPGAVAQDRTLPLIVATLIRQALGLMGVLLVVIIIYAGFLWMTAGGNDEKVTKAKKWLTNAVIGVVIIFLAYAITTFVVEAVLVSSGGTGDTGD